MKTSLIQIMIPVISLAIGYYFQWQAKRLKTKKWQADNSYVLGRMYRQIYRYETIAKVIYISAIIITCAIFLF